MTSLSSPSSILCDYRSPCLIQYHPRYFHTYLSHNSIAMYLPSVSHPMSDPCPALSCPVSVRVTVCSTLSVWAGISVPWISSRVTRKRKQCSIGRIDVGNLSVSLNLDLDLGLDMNVDMNVDENGVATTHCSTGVSYTLGNPPTSSSSSSSCASPTSTLWRISIVDLQFFSSLWSALLLA